jgi:hypothetical protein
MFRLSPHDKHDIPAHFVPNMTGKAMSSFLCKFFTAQSPCFKKAPVACPWSLVLLRPCQRWLGFGRSDQDSSPLKRTIATRQNDLSLLRFKKQIHLDGFIKTSAHPPWREPAGGMDGFGSRTPPE